MCKKPIKCWLNRIANYQQENLFKSFIVIIFIVIIGYGELKYQYSGLNGTMIGAVVFGFFVTFSLLCYFDFKKDTINVISPFKKLEKIFTSLQDSRLELSLKYDSKTYVWVAKLNNNFGQINDKSLTEWVGHSIDPIEAVLIAFKKISY